MTARITLPAFAIVFAGLATPAAARAGYVYAAFNGGLITRLDTISLVETPFANYGFNTAGLAVSPAGELYAINPLGIYRFDSSGNVSNFPGGGGGNGLAFDQAGNLYFLFYDRNAGIGRVTSAGVTEFFAEACYKSDLTTDADGNVYAAGPSTGDIRLKPDGTYDDTWIGGSWSRALTVDTIGNVYGAYSFGFQITIAPPGAANQVFVDTGSYGVVDLVVDASGNVYAGLTLNHDSYIIRYTPAGVGTFVLSAPGRDLQSLAFGPSPTAAAVPEPSAVTLSLIGVAGVAARRLRRGRSA